MWGGDMIHMVDDRVHWWAHQNGTEPQGSIKGREFLE
jgi:hypothetical protein